MTTKTSEATDRAVDAAMDRIIAAAGHGGVSNEVGAAMREALTDAETRAASWEDEAHKLEGAAVALVDIRKLCEGARRRDPAAEDNQRGYLDGRTDLAAEVLKIIDAAPYKLVEAAVPGQESGSATIILPHAWSGQWACAASPVINLRALQALAPFRPTSFLLGPETAVAFLSHPETIGFAKTMGCVEVLERQSKNFRVFGLGAFEVDETVPVGEVRLVDARDGLRCVLARLVGAIPSPEPPRCWAPLMPKPSAAAPSSLAARVLLHVRGEDPSYEAPDHLAPLAGAFERAVRGTDEGIAVFTAHVPPRHGLTTLLVHAMAVTIQENPKIRIGYATYDLRPAHAARIRCAMLVKAAGVDFDEDHYRYGFTTTSGASLHVMPVLGPCTGLGFDIFIIDSPFKNRREALDPKRQEALASWFKDVVMTRIEPGGSIIVAGPRGAKGDLHGRIRDEGVVGGPRIAHAGDRIDLPALRGRNATEALWPRRFSFEDIDRLRADMDPEAFAAVFQGEPTR